MADETGTFTVKLQPLSEETRRALEQVRAESAARDGDLVSEVAALVGLTLGVDVEVGGDEVIVEGHRIKLPLPPT